MTAKWTETTETTVPARVEREETEFELWTRRRSAYRCVTEPATPTEIGRGLQALEPAERAEALTAAGVEPTQPATPEEIGEVLAGLGDRERAVVFAVAGVPTPDELAGVVTALPPDDRLRVLRALGAKARALGPVEPRDVVETAGGRGCALLRERDGSTVKVTAGVGHLGVRGAVVKVTGSVWFENVLLVAAQRAGVLP